MIKFLILMALSLNVFADRYSVECGKQFSKIKKGLNEEISSESLSVSEVNKLSKSDLKKKLISDYVKRLSINLNDMSQDEGAFDLTKYKVISGNKLIGYEFNISDGGDESTVTYTLTNKNKVLSAFWQNQSPIRFWICEGF